MRDTVVYVAGPFIILLIVVLVVHALIALIKRKIGSFAAVVVYGVEALSVFLGCRWVLDLISAVDADVYDGPIGGTGVFGGGITIFAIMLVIFNGVGLYRVLCETTQPR